MKYLLLLIWAQVLWAQSEPAPVLLDKIVAVVNAKVVTMSEINRVEATMGARREISPQTYDKETYSKAELLNVIVNTQIIRDKIGAQGYVISDDSVESRIRQTEQKLGLNRSDLLKFLASKNITFEEYFELIRESMEFNVFSGRVIAPMITITDQEIKNEFYKRNANSNALTFKYNLVDYILPQEVKLQFTDEQIVVDLEEYQISNHLTNNLAGLEQTNIDNVKEENLSQEFQKALKQTPEGSFTGGVKQDQFIHFFYVKTKDMEESQNFLKFKDQIQMELFNQKSKSVTQAWFDREYLNYYIKRFL